MICQQDREGHGTSWKYIATSYIPGGFRLKRAASCSFRTLTGTPIPQPKSSSAATSFQAFSFSSLYTHSMFHGAQGNGEGIPTNRPTNERNATPDKQEKCTHFSSSLNFIVNFKYEINRNTRLGRAGGQRVHSSFSFHLIVFHPTRQLRTHFVRRMRRFPVRSVDCRLKAGDVKTGGC